MDDPSLDHFLDVARKTVAEFPEVFRAPAAEVGIYVAELPEKDMLADLDMSDPLDLTGLYDGIPLTEKQLWDPSGTPDVIWLFREPILAEWRDRGDVTLDQLIAHVVVHEFAHHFGWSDADIARIDRWWE